VQLPKVEKIDITSIFEHLIDVYGSSFLLSIGGFIAFMFILFLIYRFLKARGLFKTPLEISMERVQLGINQMNTFFIETMQAHEITTNHILSNQEYKLSDEQVSILIKDKEYVYSQQLIDICVDIYIKNHIKENPKKTINKLRSSVKALIKQEDAEFAKIPPAAEKIISAEAKLKGMDEYDYFTKLYDIMMEFNGECGKTEDYIRNTKRFIRNYISTYWIK
jgi:hypothetical protein